MRAARTSLMLVLLTGLTGCAVATSTVEPTAEDATYTASGRYPAPRGGILIAQSAALQEGRAMCENQGRRFRQIASAAGENPATGDAVYAVRFRCVVAGAAQHQQPSRSPDTPPGTNGDL